MKRLNEAYKAGDAEAIGNLVRQWETSPYASARPRRRAAAPALHGRGRPGRAAARARRATPTSRG